MKGVIEIGYPRTRRVIFARSIGVALILGLSCAGAGCAGVTPDHPAVYTCMMHSYLEFDAGGKCPKCGMRLCRRI